MTTDANGGTSETCQNGASDNNKSPTNTHGPSKGHDGVQLDPFGDNPDGSGSPMIPGDPAESCASGRTIGLGDILGEFGVYQLSLALLATVRFISVAMPVNYGPLITPKLNYSCLLPNASFATQIALKPNETLTTYLFNRCQLELKSGQTLECSRWTYDPVDLGESLTEAFDLVCDRDWLRSAFSAILSAGVAIGAILFGFFSDKFGRLLSAKVGFAISLVAGLVSCIASNMTLFCLSRVLCSFGDLGLVVSLSTIITETFGNKYRAATLLYIYTGWALGVMLAPITVSYYKDFKDVMIFTTLLHLITLPWLLTIKESVRWSLINGKVEEALQDSKSIHRFNFGADDGALEKKFDIFKQKFITKFEAAESVRNSKKSALCHALGLIGKCFQTKYMALTTIAIIWITFNSELLYMFCIQINSDVGQDLQLNYMLGGIMEILATILSVIMVDKMTRKFSTILTISCICILNFAMAFLYRDPDWLLWVLNADKLAVSIYSSLVYVIANECYPTSLRQSGSGLTSTFGSIGSMSAPFFRHELVQLIGMTNVFLILTVTPLTAALMVFFFIKETKDTELPDDVDDIGRDGGH